MCKRILFGQLCLDEIFPQIISFTGTFNYKNQAGWKEGNRDTSCGGFDYLLSHVFVCRECNNVGH